MKVYLAGPVSLGGSCSPAEVTAFTEVFQRVAAQLRAEGFQVLCPTELSRRESWQEYMRATIPMVCEADEVVALPRWRESRGASIEVELAGNLGIPVGEWDPRG